VTLELGIKLFTGLLTALILAYSAHTNRKSLMISKLSLEISKQNLETQKFLKQIDALNACCLRYDQLMVLRLNLESDTLSKTDSEIKKEVSGFYIRYWELQHLQFIFWERSNIEDEIMLSWMRWRHDEWVNNPTISRSGITYQEGWKNSESRFNNMEFCTFMNNVFNRGAKEAMEQVLKKR
jgi:hypothetical protein